MPDDAARHANADHEGWLKALVRANERGAAVRYFMRDMVGVPALFVLMMQTRAAACRELVAPAPLT
jgi:hypothetical protein